MKYKVLMILTISAILLLNACGKKDSAPTRRGGRDDKQPVMVEILQPRTLEEFVTVSGKLEAATDVTMLSETSGRILELYKKLGDKVNKGERIGLVDNDVYRIRLDQAEAGKLSAEAAFETANLNLTASENLFKNKTISQVEYNAAVTAFKAAKANLDGAKAGLESARKAYENSYLSAPEAGVISNLMVNVGQFINNNTPVAVITDDRTLLIKTGVGESQIAKLKKGLAADITVSGNGKTYKGFVRGIGNRPLATSANYPLEIQLTYPAGLLPGMVVTAKILTGRFENQLFTSINNIMKEFDRNYVYVVGEDNVAVRKEIQQGRIVGENVLILEGLQIGDKIVTSGMENLENNTPVEIRS